MASRGPGHLTAARAVKGGYSEEALEQQGREQAKKDSNDEQQAKAHRALPLAFALVRVGSAVLTFVRLHGRSVYASAFGKQAHTSARPQCPGCSQNDHQPLCRTSAMASSTELIGAGFSTHGAPSNSGASL